ncbi:ENPEP isoform 6 [Pan troglodytes]|uniref:ENPEP isoform 6 n=1 Tax=Pan troglodytes TaxID=9598 RepID=A0A2J8M2D5_PANTR|nr:ENPEP isoform 6 [Pan troglodytes]
MAGAPPPASLPPCSLISDCCASNQGDSVGVGPSEPGAGCNLVVRHFLSRSEKRNIRVGVTRFSSEMNPVPQMEMQKSSSCASLALGAVDRSCSYSAILAPPQSGA